MKKLKGHEYFVQCVVNISSCFTAHTWLHNVPDWTIDFHAQHTSAQFSQSLNSKYWKIWEKKLIYTNGFDRFERFQGRCYYRYAATGIQTKTRTQLWCWHNDMMIVISLRSRFNRMSCWHPDRVCCPLSQLFTAEICEQAVPVCFQT